MTGRKEGRKGGRKEGKEEGRKERRKVMMEGRKMTEERKKRRM